MQFSLEKERKRKQQSCTSSSGSGLKANPCLTCSSSWSSPTAPGSSILLSHPSFSLSLGFHKRVGIEPGWEVWWGNTFPLVSRGTHHPSRQENSHSEAETLPLFSEIFFIKILPKVVDWNPLFWIYLSIRKVIDIYMYIYTNIHVDILLCRITATLARSRTFNPIKQIKPNVQPLALAWAQWKPGLP